ncbi:uncharacterized protein PITG_01958 [Phytophthora infestans T30-4]|uniref:Uncharacterized protein n=1 Tax=Phytophthora infestans (strain T30-4) TaxID=403677 RepID=D0MUI3_PHYIT|nr:uncharacterized protein PITG_01958 [Phytophthora infestans T30-4]EEY61630.1 conserved hypothetical protein [Phytophthora infestans T30-4]|eukprot:XP_002908547.1 conserved hypothetical protein [Phytophthora infestans T30-4]
MAERRQSSRSSTSRYRTRSSSTPPSKRSLGFSTPSASSAVSPPSLSPTHDELSTDRVLTFLQSAQDRNVPVRFGKWSLEEDAYLAKLIWLFENGLLVDIEHKMSLRSFLALMLDCCPMRISKKQMHGHKFVGKTKYVRRNTQMTQKEYDKLCQEVSTLRHAFIKAWARDEYDRRSNRAKEDATSFQNWYDRAVSLVPMPKLAKRPNLKEYKRKRHIEPLDEVETHVQSTKRQQVEKTSTIRPVQAAVDHLEREDAPQVEMLEPVEILPLEPAPIPDSTVVTALPTSYCSETVNMGDWLANLDRGRTVTQWTDFQTVNHVGETRYTLCEDAVQVSLHLSDQQPSMAGLSIERRSSRLIIDFGAPSCWSMDEESKHEPSCDYSEWADHDLAEELAMTTDPGIFGWDDASSLPHLAYNPTVNFL